MKTYYNNTQFAEIETAFVLGFYNARETAARAIDIVTARAHCARRGTLLQLCAMFQYKPVRVELLKQLHGII